MWMNDKKGIYWYIIWIQLPGPCNQQLSTRGLFASRQYWPVQKKNSTNCLKRVRLCPCFPQLFIFQVVKNTLQVYQLTQHLPSASRQTNAIHKWKQLPLNSYIPGGCHRLWNFFDNTPWVAAQSLLAQFFWHPLQTAYSLCTFCWITTKLHQPMSWLSYLFQPFNNTSQDYVQRPTASLQQHHCNQYIFINDNLFKQGRNSCNNHKLAELICNNKNNSKKSNIN